MAEDQSQTESFPAKNDAPRSEPRVLVFLVSYEAGRHIGSTLGRVPQSLLDDGNVDLLLIDDASRDDTASLAQAWAQERGFRRLTVLRNPVNQGYGGNQKLGYRLAIDHGYDFVILLHGDGQYAPELLPQFIETYRATRADVVLGTRMDSIRSARAGGMPWYKVAGNSALTWMQNKLTGQALTEYHTGYRAYSTRFLRAVPFEINTNAFHFDTEILLQAFHVGARIEQFPIPTHYGDEICRVDGTRYAKDVMLGTIQFRLHQLGMLCSLKYRDLSPLDHPAKTRVPYTAQTLALREIERLRPRTILDVGCGAGLVAQACKSAISAEVTGVDLRAPLADSMHVFHQCDIEREPFPVDAFDFEAVLLLDIIENLAEPEKLLIGMRNSSRATNAIRTPPAVLISTPNIAFAAMRLNLLLGRFNYAERGILDIRHKRLFTRRALRRTLDECGYTIERLIPVGVPFAAVTSGGRIGRFLGWLSAGAAKLWPSLFAFQFLVVARPRPGLRQLLAQSEQHLSGPLKLAQSGVT